MTGRPRPDSDLDVAAALHGVDPWAVDVGDRVDLAALQRLPLAVAGRVALTGVLLFDDDPPARVAWQADTRLRWLDESWRRTAAQDVFLARASRG